MAKKQGSPIPSLDSRVLALLPSTKSSSCLCKGRENIPPRAQTPSRPSQLWGQLPFPSGLRNRARVQLHWDVQEGKPKHSVGHGSALGLWGEQFPDVLYWVCVARIW